VTQERRENKSLKQRIDGGEFALPEERR